MVERPRRYNSPVRARQAGATRQAILAAARRLFVEVGYQATTMDSIAIAAEVSVPTVYTTFRSKQGILAALVSGAVAEASIRRLAEETEREADPQRKLRMAAHVMRLALESEAELTDILWQAGSGNEELLAAWRQMHANRHRRLSEVLSPILNAPRSKHFVDVAWALGSPEMYRLLVREHGWTPKQFESWLAETLVGQHNGVPGGGGRRALATT